MNHEIQTHKSKKQNPAKKKGESFLFKKEKSNKKVSGEKIENSDLRREYISISANVIQCLKSTDSVFSPAGGSPLHLSYFLFLNNIIQHNPAFNSGFPPVIFLILLASSSYLTVL